MASSAGWSRRGAFSSAKRRPRSAGSSWGLSRGRTRRGMRSRCGSRPARERRCRLRASITTSSTTMSQVRVPLAPGWRHTSPAGTLKAVSSVALELPTPARSWGGTSSRKLTLRRGGFQRSVATAPPLRWGPRAPSRQASSVTVVALVVMVRFSLLHQGSSSTPPPWGWSGGRRPLISRLRSARLQGMNVEEISRLIIFGAWRWCRSSFLA